jgi:hypothetical protein
MAKKKVQIPLTRGPKTRNFEDPRARDQAKLVTDLLVEGREEEEKQEQQDVGRKPQSLTANTGKELPSLTAKTSGQLPSAKSADAKSNKQLSAKSGPVGPGIPSAKLTSNDMIGAKIGTLNQLSADEKQEQLNEMRKKKPAANPKDKKVAQATKPVAAQRKLKPSIKKKRNMQQISDELEAGRGAQYTKGR